MTGWVEIGDRVFVHRYEFWDQNIGVVLGDDAALVIDTRMTPRQAEEIRTDLRELTPFPVEIVVDTHGHSDHAFGNSVFRPTTIWAHVGCGPFLERTGEEQRQRQIRQFPDMADDLRAVVIDLPDRSFEDHARITVGGRPVELRYLGRGHTDHDIVVIVPGAGVTFAGDLLEGGAVPSFGDSFPLDWPASVEALLPLIEDVVVPGHGDHAGRAFAEEQLESFRGLAELARRVAAGELTADAALALTPFPAYPPEDLAPALERTLAQLRGAVT
jgi:glyoxylase-like metal-dependent hydrolase (beta-lactamase superfamily II)